MAQTSVKNSKTIRFGSAKFEVGADVGSLVDLGAMRAIKFTEEWTKVQTKSDNAGIIAEYTKDHMATLEGELMEINLANLNLLRGGIDTYATVAGTLVSGYSQAVASGAWSYDKFIPFTNQNGDGSKITPTSVTGSVDGLLEANTDYFITKTADGVWGIAVRDSATVTTQAQTITIVYNYTPAASATLKSGGINSITAKVVRVTNTNAAGKAFRITVYKATTEEGIVIEFPEDDGEDPAVVPIMMKGTLDVNRTAGDQLFEIYDEQYV